MKKFLLMLLALVLCLSLVACGGTKKSSKNDDDDDDTTTESSEAADTIVGKYMLYSLSMYGETLDYDGIVDMGVEDSYIELKEDGTFTLSLYGEDPTNGTYDEAAKTLTAEGESVSFTIDGDKLSIQMEDETMTFTKGKIAGKDESSKDESSEDDPTFDFNESSDSFVDVTSQEDTVYPDSDSDSAEVGKYMIYSMTAEGTVVTKEQLELIGYESSYLEIKSDGTFVLEFSETIEGDHDADEKALLVDGDPAYYTMDGDYLTLILAEDISITFKK